jgi:hypothetical protein
LGETGFPQDASPKPDNREKLAETSPEPERNVAVAAGQPILAGRVEQATPLQMDPVLMSRYGLLRPGVIDSKSKDPRASVSETIGPSAPQAMPSRRTETLAIAPTPSDSTRALEAKKRELEELAPQRDSLALRAELEKAEAYEKVTLKEGVREVQGSKLVYTAANDQYVITGPQVLIIETQPKCNEMMAKVAIYDRTTGAMKADGADANTKSSACTGKRLF